MSEEITAPRSVPPAVEHQAAAERDFSDLRREVIESRNLVIKTDNLLKNLHAELKQMGRKQELFEKRHMMTSVAAYFLFAALATLGAFSFARSEIRGAREEAAANEGKAKQLTQEVEMLRRAEGSRRDASEKAARAYDLLGSEKEGPGQTLAMDQALHADRQLLSRLEAKALDDRAAGMKAKMAQAALERGNAAFRRNDWTAAAQELSRYIELEPRVEESMVWFRLGNALTQAKEHQRAIPALESFIKASGGTKTAQYAGYLLGTDYEETNNAEKARQTYERALGLYPSSEFSALIRGRLKRLSGQKAAAQPPAPVASPAPAAQAANPKL
ncbi:MAG: tetratricopeptide repeat protein [Myxococcales bacterium]